MGKWPSLFAISVPQTLLPGHWTLPQMVFHVLTGFFWRCLTMENKASSVLFFLQVFSIPMGIPWAHSGAR